MRSFYNAFMLLIIICYSAFAQQFYRSKGIDLFNQGQYAAAIDSMMQWGDAHSAEKGIAYYYVGESDYTLGIDELSPAKSISFFTSAVDVFYKALNQSDLNSIYASKKDDVIYKRAWSCFRLAEIADNPVVYLEKAYDDFSRLSVSESDTLSLYAKYMVGETQFRIALWYRYLSAISGNTGEAVEFAQEAIRNLNLARNIYRQIVNQDQGSSYFRTCASFKIQDILCEWGGLYQGMDNAVFEQINDSMKKENSTATAIYLCQQVNYRSVLQNIDHFLKIKFEPLVSYSRAYDLLSLYLLTNDELYQYQFNSVLDSIRNSDLQSEKYFLQGISDHNSDITGNVYRRLADTNTSFYMKAAKDNPEALYWLGWAQFAANMDDAETQFELFLQNSESPVFDPRLNILREDAQFRIFLIRFDRNAGDQKFLVALKQQLEQFSPRNTYIREQKKFLLQLVRVGLGESIWGEILSGPNTAQRLDDAFYLIRHMLERATRVIGKERIPYLNYLEKLYKITEPRKPNETSFYRGLSLFLKAEIQETSSEKRNLYLAAADTLRNSTGEYRNESMYVQARSYFAAAKHEPKPGQRSALYEKARPIFIKLINEANSLRSVYYLGEIFRIRGNELAAKRCYETVMRNTRGQSDGKFWYNNALAGIQSSQMVGDSTQLQGIKIERVKFPEQLLVINNETISLEKFADLDYIRRQYVEQAVRYYLKYGPPKRTLYPSVFRLPVSRFRQRDFGENTAGIREKVPAITSGLRLQVILPKGSYQAPLVTLNRLPVEKNQNGFYQKAPIPLNQLLEIRVESNGCYPFVEEHQFSQPGVEYIIVSLVQRLSFKSEGFGKRIQALSVPFTKRLDGNTILLPNGLSLMSNTFLFRDFESKITLRDIDYSEVINRFLVADSKSSDLLVYRNDAMLSKEGILPLIVQSKEDTLGSPEGIAIDRQGRIYIADWSNHRVAVFESDGRFIRSFGGFGKNSSSTVGKPVRFVFPTRIAIAEDSEGIFLNGTHFYHQPQIFVSDRNGIHLVNTDGIYWDTITPRNIERGDIYDIITVNYGSDLQLYVANRRNGEIETFSARAVDESE